jgi:putative proteasome-type protease
MTYCVAMSLDAGLIFLSDSRTNAGVDQVGTFRKMTVFENPGDRMMVLMSAGNLAISQSIRQLISEHASAGNSLWNATSMYEAAQIVGEAVRTIYERDAKALGNFGIDFNVSMLLGGQIGSEPCRLFQIYSAGNFIESQNETPFFQIGEAKYGKPILDLAVTPSATLEDVTKCVLVSFDSTMLSNLSVGMPIDLLCYRRDELAVTMRRRFDVGDGYFELLKQQWLAGTRRIFHDLPALEWRHVPPDAANAGG